MANQKKPFEIEPVDKSSLYCNHLVENYFNSLKALLCFSGNKRVQNALTEDMLPFGKLKTEKSPRGTRVSL